MIKRIALWLLLKLGISTAGPLGGLAAYVTQFFLVFLWGKISNGLKKLYTYLRGLMATKQDEKDQTTYDNALQDGATEQQQVDATTDILNGNR